MLIFACSFKKLTLNNHVIMHKVKSLLCMARRSHAWPLAQGDGGGYDRWGGGGEGVMME